MTDWRTVPVAEVKRDFKRVLDAAERGETTVVTRHGKAVAVIGPPPSDRPPLPRPEEPGGLLSLAGVLAEWETIEEDVARVVAERQRDMGRPPPELD